MKKGFTLIEILVALGIIVLLCVIIIGSFSSFRKSQNFNNAIEDTISIFNSARAKTLSSENASQYGIHLDSSKATLFKGTVFSQTDPNNQIINLDSSIEIVNISINGGGSDVVFNRLKGDTSDHGSFVIRVKSDTSKSKTISIKSTGIVNAL